MVLISEPLPALSPNVVGLYSAADPLLSNSPVLVFYGPSITTNATLNSSRIQAHIFTLAGFRSYPRLTISPNSPLYAAVDCLPPEKQGDEICRGLAVSLMKYFSDVPEIAKSVLAKSARPVATHAGCRTFENSHAGNLAGRLTKVENVASVIEDIQAAWTEQSLPWVDVDVILPRGSISIVEPLVEADESQEVDEDPTLLRYGTYASLIKLFGLPAFIPTSKLRRAPSRPTAVSRSRSFLKHQKESLRREMCELVDTEERYVSKLYDLVHSVAGDFRQKARARGSASTSPTENALERLFPRELDQILAVNTNFLNAIRAVLEETENEAIEDIQAETDFDYAGSRTGKSGRRKDATGAVAFSKVLLKCFPKFGKCYPNYMRASVEFSEILNTFMRDMASSFSKRVHETGEQRLRSMLIEPVQRLPRYSLFIDNIVNLLPATHPALNLLFQARDIITDICSLDLSSSSEQSQLVNRLRNIISSWPSSLVPRGRLVTAADFAELMPPYRMEAMPTDVSTGILLLFPDYIVILRRTRGGTMSARGVLAEIDRPSAATMAVSAALSPNAQRPTQELVFCGSIRLQDVRFTESSAGRLIWMSHAYGMSNSASHNGFPEIQGTGAGVRVFHLQGAYESRASRWIEEVAKARIEGRYTEEEREQAKWGLRSVSNSAEGLGLFAAILEEESDLESQGREDTALIRVVVDKPRTSKQVLVGQYSIEVAVSLTVTGDGKYRLEVDGLNNYGSCDDVTAGTFLAVLTKRCKQLIQLFISLSTNRMAVGNLLRLQHQLQNPALTALLLSLNRNILGSLAIRLEGDQSRFRTLRPPSPVKMLSNLLGGITLRDPGSPTKQRPQPSQITDTPIMLPPPLMQSNSEGQTVVIEEEVKQKITVIETNGTLAAGPPVKSLEETLVTYTIALHARRGNVVARVLRGRAGADELAVNEVYNTLLEDPSKYQVAAEVAVDVLFVAFEKFLNVAWKESMGLVITAKMLRSVQDKSGTLFRGAFEDYFKGQLADMTPQNRRGFESIIKLLADLLEGSSNDGDRGALTATFAELLVTEGNPHDYITLLDRLVDDVDGLFDHTMSHSATSEGAPANGSVNSLKRGTSVNTGSLSSNASSFRKRFGFSTNNTLSRENSKSESESKVSSVWRTLSKSSRGTTNGDGQPSSISRATLSRSRSTDIDGRVESPKRPLSRDRPAALGTFSFEEPVYRPGSAYNNLSGLGTIGEAASTPKENPPRKKRRSSLSDLKSLPNSPATPAWSPLTPRKHIYNQQPKQQVASSPRTPSPTKVQNTSFLDASPATRFGAPNRKENSPSPPRNMLTERASNIKSEEASLASFGQAKKQNGSISGIPTLKAGLKERTPVPNRADSSPSKKAPASPQKLKMQSPQKLRERLQNEQKAISSAESELQAELSKIGDELSSLSLRPSSHTNTSRATAPSLASLSTRLTALETSLPTHISTLSSTLTNIQTDLSTSLIVADTKAKKLDELYREANAENEALYERFNDELGRVLGRVRAGEGGEELKRRVKEGEEDSGRLRRENARLKREVAGLRSQLRGE
ncbi:MAG: hypothetical protein M1835_003943 [Candelina submexicana]|nr:MAG: hypothetical protein M1835_003943 [Candelina submexicana]